jgi:hypothetical protein
MPSMSNSLKFSFSLPPLVLALVYAYKRTIINSLFVYSHGNTLREVATKGAAMWFYDERGCAAVAAAVAAADAAVISAC